MKDIEKDTPEVSGGAFDAYGNPIGTAYPIFPVPLEQTTSPLTLPESPCAPDPV